MTFKPHNYLFLIQLLLLPFISISAQGTLDISKKIDSKILHQEEAFSIYLPEHYNDSNTYPTLYLLHGYGGNENSWIEGDIHKTLDSLILHKQLPEVIVVFPNGHNSYFMNDYSKSYLYEDYFIEEFMPFIDSNYNTSTIQSKIAIAGLSMGGFGATLLPIKHPSKFGTSISLSGAVRTQEEFIDLSPVKYHGYFARIYGDSLIGADRITRHWKANSPYTLISDTNLQAISNINWYIDCGMHDFLFKANQSLHRLFLDKDIPHEYHMRQGEHNWEYWETGIIYGLVYWGKILKDL